MSLRFNIKRNTKRTALAIFSCCVCVFVNSQSFWNKTYLEDRGTMLFSSVVKVNQDYRLIGVVSGPPNNGAKGIIGQIDSNGAMNKYIAIGDSINEDFGLFWNALIQTNDGRLAFTGYCRDSLPSIVFGVTNMALDSVSVFKYYTPQTDAFQGYSLIQYDDSTFYIAGVHTPAVTPSNTNVLLLKIDRFGNRVWEKYYHNQKIDYARSIVKLTNGHLLLGALANNLNQTNERSNTWLLEVDTGGTIVRQWLDTNDSTYAAEGLLQTHDGGFIYGAQKKNLQSVNDVYKIATIVKMDSAFNKQWTYSAGRYDIFTGIYDIVELQDGSFIACGNKPYYNNDSSVRSGWIIKLSQSGQVIWDKVYRGIATRNTENFLIDIDVLPDGGIIAVGQCQQSIQPRQVGWFLKLDSNGCVIENCLVGIEGDNRQQTIDDRLIKIQPNPATGTVQLVIENEMIGGLISLYNITGALVLQQTAEAEKTMLNINSLQKGLYIVVISRGTVNARAKLVVD